MTGGRHGGGVIPAFAGMTLLLAACGQAGDHATAEGEDNRIECRIGNAVQFERLCTVEQVERGGARTLVVRKPDGGFRRLRVTGDGRGVVAADGAEPAEVTIIAGNRIEIAIGGDSFRLPATVQDR